jgi:hypothetical protein
MLSGAVSAGASTTIIGTFPVDANGLAGQTDP